MHARTLPATAGWHWLRGGLLLWRKNPGILSMATLMTLLLTSVPAMVPWLGPLLVCLMAPFLDVVLLHVCRQLALGRPPVMQALRAQLLRNARALLVLGVVMFIGLTVARGLRDLLAGGEAEALMAAAAKGEARAVPANVMFGFLVYWFGVSVLSVVMWVAPPLAAFANVPPLKALFFAVVSCWRNKAALLVYGLSLLLFSIPLSLLMLVGQLGQILASMVILGVLMPACVASNYLSLVDIFGPMPEPGDDV
jgi:hypothetical protein